MLLGLVGNRFLTAVNGLDLDVAQLDVQGAFVVTSGLSPVKKKRAKVLLEDPENTEIVHCTF